MGVIEAAWQIGRLMISTRSTLINFQSGKQRRRTTMKAEYLNNWQYLSTTVRDAAREVLAKTTTLKEAAQKYELPAEYIESKILDSTFEPPKQRQRPNHSIIDTLRETPLIPRDVLNVEDKATKAAIIKDTELTQKEKRSTHPLRVRCIEQAARETKVLTVRAAAEKYNVSEDDVRAQVKDPRYASLLEAPLGPNMKKRVELKNNTKRGDAMEYEGALTQSEAHSMSQ
jgi:hypothetical protein